MRYLPLALALTTISTTFGWLSRFPLTSAHRLAPRTRSTLLASSRGRLPTSIVAMSSLTITDPKQISGRVADYAILAGEALAFSGAWAFPPASDGMPMRVMLRRSVRDVEKDKQRSMLLNYMVTGGDQPRWVEGGAFAMELSGVVAMSASPSGRYMLLFKDEGKEGESKPVVEVWSRSSLLAVVALDEVHGRVMGDTWFGGFSWSADERVLAYVAEVKRPKPETAFKPDEKKKDDDKPKPTTGLPANKFEYKEDWGEKYDGVCKLGLYLLSVETGRVATVQGIDPTTTPGQPALSRDGRHLVYTAWSELPRKLGIIFCHQRPAALYALDIADTLTALLLLTDPDGPPPSSSPPAPVCLTPSDRVARSPVFSRDGRHLAYLGNDKGFDTHNGPIALRLLDWQAFATSGPTALRAQTLVDTVARPDSPGAFPGLWLDNLPRECWALDDACLYLTSMWGSRAVVLRVDAAGKGVSIVEGRDKGAILPTQAGISGEPSTSLLSVTPDGRLLVSSSSPRCPGGFGLLSPSGAYLPGPSIESAVVCSSAYPKDRYTALREALPTLRWEVLSLTPPTAPAHPFEAILLLPPPSSSSTHSLPPLVVVPHGGPHSVMPTSFLHSYAYLCLSHHLALLHVNFRGSTGFGSDPLDSLPGRIGQQDVADVLQATQAVIDKGVVDGERVGIVGGSHGGFLAAHMIGQHPDVYKVAALRNPVTNIPGMVTSTDIPDWTFVEALGAGSYDFSASNPPSAEQLVRMWECSPIAHVHRVRAPTLVALGQKDRRVPFSQGMEFYHALRARGVPAKLLVYPEDVHAIDKPASEADHWIQIGEWLHKYL